MDESTNESASSEEGTLFSGQRANRRVILSTCPSPIDSSLPLLCCRGQFTRLLRGDVHARGLEFPPATSALLIRIISITAALLRESDCCCALLRCSRRSLTQNVKISPALSISLFYLITCSGERGSWLPCRPWRGDGEGTTSSCTGRSPPRREFCKCFRGEKVP